MTVMRLTQQLVNQGLKCPKDNQKMEICDADCRGLYALVTAGSQVWYYRAKVGGKTSHQRLGNVSQISLAEARKQVVLLRGQIAAGVNLKGDVTAKKEAPTLHDFFYDHYLPFAKPRKRSWKRDEELYRLRIDAAFGHKKLGEISRHEFSSFMTTLLASGLRPASVNHHAKLVKRLITVACQFDMAETNQLSRIPMFAEDNKEERYMNEEELERLLTVLRTDENRVPALMALWLLSTGARCGEAQKATFSQIDEANRVWRVPASNTKAKKVRAIPLNDSALDVLKQLRELDCQGEYVFTNKKTGKPYVTIVKTWANMRVKAGLPRLRIHDLRHQYASFLVNAGRTLFEVQSILGHSDPSQTARYSHLSTKSLSDAANAASIMIQKGMHSGV